MFLSGMLDDWLLLSLSHFRRSFSVLGSSTCACFVLHNCVPLCGLSYGLNQQASIACIYPLLFISGMDVRCSTCGNHRQNPGNQYFPRMLLNCEKYACAFYANGRFNGVAVSQSLKAKIINMKHHIHSCLCYLASSQALEF